MKRCVTVVDGPLAFGMRRLEAARANDVGLEVLTLPLLASRLAGGFRHLVDRETLSMAVGRALLDGGFAQIDGVRHSTGNGPGRFAITGPRLELGPRSG